MSQVTIRGTITPSVLLARGETRTVELTDRIQRLIDRGFVELVSDPEEAEPAEVTEQPADNATRKLWQLWVSRRWPDQDITGLTRTELQQLNADLLADDESTDTAPTAENQGDNAAEAN